MTLVPDFKLVEKMIKRDVTLLGLYQNSVDFHNLIDCLCISDSWLEIFIQYIKGLTQEKIRLTNEVIKLRQQENKLPEVDPDLITYSEKGCPKDKI